MEADAQLHKRCSIGAKALELHHTVFLCRLCCRELAARPLLMDQPGVVSSGAWVPRNFGRQGLGGKPKC